MATVSRRAHSGRLRGVSRASSPRPASGSPKYSAVEERASRRQLADIQRSRLLAAAIRAVDDLGYSGATVAQITRGARVSRRTFYELFTNREECLLAIIEDVVDTIEHELADLGLAELPWRERVRTGLWVILSFFDREPILARVCVVQAQAGGAPVLERREEVLTRLAEIVDEGRQVSAPRAGALTQLTAEGIVGAAFAIVHSRLRRERPQPLRDLLGELMGMIVLPYQGAAVARKEQERPAPTRLSDAARMFAKAPRAAGDPLDGVPMRLTYRTARVLEGIGEQQGLSNREVADYAGISDQGQVSKLLARLERLQLLFNEGQGHAKGEPNAWKLTTRGQLVAQSISQVANQIQSQ
jgi:AcrR family transcriptional regulator